jgi:hypothetical protein
VGRAVSRDKRGRWRDARGVYCRPPGLSRVAMAEAAVRALAALPADSPLRAGLEYTARTGRVQKDVP